ncbi:MAG: RNase P modulator RnpM [Anaerolineae bacterium]
MRHKHIPQRTCIGCRQVRSKREMIRVVRTPKEGVQIDHTGKKSGRGAYLCPNRTCWETALTKGRLAHALKTTLTAEEQSMLWAFVQSLTQMEQEREKCAAR